MSTSETTVRSYPGLKRPEGFTSKAISWVPWLVHPEKHELSHAQSEALSEHWRPDFPYFRLLSLDPPVLKARTRTDRDIFHTEGGLDRAERELSAAVASRVNGCVFCASVHSREAITRSGRADEVNRLLEEGVTARSDDRWNAIVDASAAITRSPIEFDASHVARLRAQGLDDVEIYDLILAASYFNWANRLMLSIGEPEVI